MIQITATEFKKNFGKYLMLVNTGDILVTRNGIPIAQITIPKDFSLVDQLIGIIPDDGYSIEDARKGRLKIDEDTH